MRSGKGNTVTSLNPHHLHREVLVDGVSYVEAYWAKDWAGRDPSPAEKNVLCNTNRRKRAKVADPNAAERGALKLLINVPSGSSSTACAQTCCTN
jgi:hypothetical protein